MAQRTREIVDRVKPKRPGRARRQLVKSAARVLQIIELFDSIKSPTTEAAIAAVLNIPQSSASSLLKTIVAMGYMTFDRSSRTYALSSRVALMGNWVDPYLVRDGPVVELMHALCNLIGKNVVLITRNDLHVQIVHVVQPARKDHPYVSISVGRPLLNSPAGLTLLSQLSEPEIRRIARRHNADLGPDMEAVDIRDILDSVDRIRKSGAIFHVNDTPEEGWVIAVPLPKFSNEQPFSLGVGDFSITPDIDPDEVVKVMKPLIASWADKLPRHLALTANDH